MGSNGVSYDSITTIHGIGKDWGRLPHREPFYVKRSKDRRRDHEGYVSQHDDDQEQELTGEHRDPGKEKAHAEGFEITV